MTSTEKNKELIEKYPFLLPRNRFSDEVVKDFDYSFTELDAMPDGWLKAFGEQMCEEIKQALEKDGLVNKYRIYQIKEKFGSLRWYDGNGNKEINKIVSKYEKLSMKICIQCGSKATKVSTDWISPYCDKCSIGLRNITDIDNWEW